MSSRKLLYIIIILILFLPLSISAQTIVQQNQTPLSAEDLSKADEELIEKTKEEVPPPNEVELSERTIAISPNTLELTANRGEKITNKLRVRNTGTEPLALSMDAEDFTTVGEGGEVVVKEAEDLAYALAKWIIINPKQFALAPGEERTVDFTIIVPVNAEPGGHYATVMAGATSAIEGTTGVAFAQKVGSLVLLTVAGEIKENLFIREFKTPHFSEYGPIPFKIRFENAGTVHVKPVGFISITDMFDAKLIDIPFPARNIFPGKTRLIDDVKWDKKWLFGKYTATLVGNYGLSNTPFMALTTFWVIPWKILGGTILGLLIISFFLWRIRRRILAAVRILLTGK